jgi:hypothetical protein
MAQVEEKRTDGYVVRANAVAGTLLPEETRRAHGIPPDRGMLNVVVMIDDAGLPETLPARVSAQVRDLRGRAENVEMREIRENEEVSYLGTFRFRPRETMRFDVTVEIPGRAPVHMDFQKRFFGELPAGG